MKNKICFSYPLKCMCRSTEMPQNILCASITERFGDAKNIFFLIKNSFKTPHTMCNLHKLDKLQLTFRTKI